MSGNAYDRCMERQAIGFVCGSRSMQALGRVGAIKGRARLERGSAKQQGSHPRAVPQASLGDALGSFAEVHVSGAVVSRRAL